MKKIKNFFGEVNHEMKETNWPSAKELRKNSITIFSVMILFGIFFFFSDLFIQFVFNLI